MGMTATTKTTTILSHSGSQPCNVVLSIYLKKKNAPFDTFHRECSARIIKSSRWCKWSGFHTQHTHYNQLIVIVLYIGNACMCDLFSKLGWSSEYKSSFSTKPEIIRKHGRENEIRKINKNKWTDLMSFKYIRNNVTKRDRMHFTLINQMNWVGIMIRQLK